MSELPKRFFDTEITIRFTPLDFGQIPSDFKGLKSRLEDMALYFTSNDLSIDLKGLITEFDNLITLTEGIYTSHKTSSILNLNLADADSLLNKINIIEETIKNMEYNLPPKNKDELKNNFGELYIFIKSVRDTINKGIDGYVPV